ncbi:MAG: glycosyltransferase family A protein [Acidimicrobiales bacterium]|jgi:glycosyltransferase involved in cell wall biosynthesis
MTPEDSGEVPAVSLVICTRDRLASLKRSVEAALAIETTREWELVVVDNGSSDGTSDYLRDLQASTGKQLLTVYQPHPGLGKARNAGWKAARAPIIAFTDDDCYVAADYIDAVISAFEPDPSIAAIGGRILLYDPSDLNICITESTEPLVIQPYRFIPAGLVQGSNMAFRRGALAAIGGFDERFGAGTNFPAEDIDAFAALAWKGMSAAYDPRPVVYHHHGRKTASDLDRLSRAYDAGRGAYYAKYLLKRRSAVPYLKAWAQASRSELAGRGTAPHARREVASAVRYLVSRLATSPQAKPPSRAARRTPPA